MRRTIVITSAGTRLSVEHGTLIIHQEGSERGRISFEDMDLLVLETPACTVSGAALNGLLAVGGAALVCDAKHLPVGLLLPLAASSLVAQRHQAQVAASLPLQKNLWRKVIQTKIDNQARNLPSGAAQKRLLTLKHEVLSGDSRNVEAQAARSYWPAWGGTCALTLFARGDETSTINGMLDYGYAILRALVARALCTAGLSPILGLHHHHRSNPYPLADDVMECCRPWVDRLVARLVTAGTLEVTTECKRALQALPVEPAILGKETTPLGVAIERMAASLAACYLEATAQDGELSAEQGARRLELPTIPRSELC